MGRIPLVAEYLASDDPDFEGKAADIIGLYLESSATCSHAAVFCVDETTTIQALDRLDPVLPLSPPGGVFT